MRLGRKLSEGYAVDRDAEARDRTGDDHAVPVEAVAAVDTVDPVVVGAAASPVTSGRPPVG